MTNPTHVDDGTLAHIRRQLPAIRSNSGIAYYLDKEIDALLSAHEALRAEREWVRQWLERAPTAIAPLPYFKIGDDGESLAPAGMRDSEVWDKQAMLAEFYDKFCEWGPIPQPPGGD